MPAYKKEQLLDIVTTFEKANSFIKGGTGEKEQMWELLVECQELAISLGEELEKHGKKAESLVRILEDYCEIIYQQSMVVSDFSTCARYCKKIKGLLVKVKNGIKFDLPQDKKEVVFLPYQASMWDSMESIWMAARNDDDCEAYVIPIPYFAKLEDGTLGEMYEEGNKYPDYVPITSWQEYDLEERRPDMIFIHNPYDAWNHVTSVHPDYFARKLRKYTKKLIYVPYFVLQEVSSKDQNTIEQMKHFCFLPGIIYSDYVIVQSEAMKQIYVNEFEKEAQKNHLPVNRKDLEQKILGLGSPKFDKVYEVKKGELEIPREWRKIIEKSDGGWKKIILFNTSISSLLTFKEQMLRKMEDVFRIFEENQQELVLLWRPHPLMQYTIKSMRIGLWDSYQALVDRYQRMGWGIYDSSADLDRAIVLSDAYYGDPSSLVQLCQELHKRIMIENPTIIRRIGKNDSAWELKDLHLQFEDLYDDGSYYWFTSRNFNGLFRMDKVTCKAEYITSFPNEELDGSQLYGTIVEHKDKLYFTPYRARELAIYDKKSGEVLKVSLEDLNVGYLKGYGGWNYYSAHIYQENIYILPHQRTAIIKYDTQSGEVSAISKWVSDVTDNFELTGPRFVTRSIIQNDIIYAPISGCNLLETINLETGNTQVYQLGNIRNTYRDICFFQDKFWLCPLEGNEIIVWDSKSETEKVYVFQEEVTTAIQFCGLAKNNQCIYFFPYMYKHVIAGEPDGENIKWKSHKFCEEQENHYIYCGSNNGIMYAFNETSRMFIEYSSKSQIKRSVTISMSLQKSEEIEKLSKDIYNCIHKKIKDGIIQIESDNLNLQKYLHFILEESDSENDIEDTRYSAGKTIYEKLR